MTIAYEKIVKEDLDIGIATSSITNPTGGTALTGTQLNTTTWVPGLYNVKDYGAVGNGTHDDAVAIQAAITACTVAGAGVYFPVGTYAISVPLIIPSYAKLIGAHKANTRIKATAAMDVMIKTATVDTPSTTAYVDIENMTLDANSVATLALEIGAESASYLNEFMHLANLVVTNATNGIQINSVVYSSMRDVFVSGVNVSGTTGLKFAYQTQECHCTNVMVNMFEVNWYVTGTGIIADHCISYAEALNATHGAGTNKTLNLLKLEAASKNVFRDCYWEYLDTDAISEVLISGGVGSSTYPNYNRFEGCVWFGTGANSSGLELGVGGLAMVQGTVIKDCIFINTRSVDILFTNCGQVSIIDSYRIQGYSGGTATVPVVSGSGSATPNLYIDRNGIYARGAMTSAGLTNGKSSVSVVGNHVSTAPATTGVVQVAGLRAVGSTGAAIDVGTDPDSPYGGWIQVSSDSNLSNNFPLALNPNGGNVGIGTLAPGSALSIVGLPTSDSGLAAGDIWVDTTADNVLKIVT